MTVRRQHSAVSKKENRKRLGSTSQVGNGPVVPDGIGHGFGHSDRDGGQVKNREVEEEVVHGSVEVLVAGYDSDDEAIAEEGSQVDGQEEPEGQELHLRRVCECQEEEADDGSAFGQMFPVGMGSCP